MRNADAFSSRAFHWLFYVYAIIHVPQQMEDCIVDYQIDKAMPAKAHAAPVRALLEDQQSNHTRSLPDHVIGIP